MAIFQSKSHNDGLKFIFKFINFIYSLRPINWYMRYKNNIITFVTFTNIKLMGCFISYINIIKKKSQIILQKSLYTCNIKSKRV